MDAGRGITVCYMVWTTNTEGRRTEARMVEDYFEACKRLVHVEENMKRNWQFAQEYTRIIKDYVSKGYA
ncbi:GL15388 [Drosophila persimilis]|uniref:GL15388 n=1 Tax=Drosophila persimilis TaxID=7234 RepID=B4HBC5_DROPE|nr:GL15388 [Drosophila persimilis]